MKHFISSLSVLCANTPPCEGRISSRKILSLLLILFLGVGNAWGETVTLSTNSTTVGKGTPVTDKFDYKLTFTSTTEAGNAYVQNAKSSSVYNTIAIPGTITSIKLTDCATTSTKTDGSFKVYAGTDSGDGCIYEMGDITGLSSTKTDKIIDFSGNYSYFKIVVGSSRVLKISSIIITYTPSAGGGETPDPTPTKLSAPVNLKEASITETSATLSWDAVTNASNYSVTINGNTEAVTTNSYSATGLTAGTEYTWSVVAKGDGTNYTDSDAAQHTFTTTTTTPDPEPGTGANVTYDFTKIDGFSSWGNSYSSHEVTYSDAKVTFEAASKQTSNITDCPVTKGKSVVLVMTDGMNIATVKWVCTQWTTKAQTITLHYSKDGGNVYTSTEITSTDFTISSDNLPAGTNAVKITFNSTSNQVGIKSCTITKVEAAAITQVPAPQFSLTAGAYDGAQSVELTCTMADATIYYTTDGNTPTTSSAVYSTAIQVAENMTIKAYAVKEGLEDSPVAEATYEISAPADVVLDFTTNNWGLPSGSTNKATTEASYTDGTYTVSIAGTNGHYFDTNNLITGKKDAYIVLPIFNKPIVKIVCEGVDAGSGSVTFNVFIGDDAVSAEVTGCKTEQTFLITEDKQVANVAHVIKVTNANNLRIAKIKIYLGEAPAVEKPVIGGEEEFAVSTEVSITCATSGAKIYYTIDGNEPTNASAEYTAPFELSATTTVKAIAYADGQASAVATKTFTFIETITCVQAAEIALAQSANNVQTEKKYRIVAYVTETLSAVSSNQQSFKVVDNIGDESVFQSYYCNVPEAMAAGMKVEMIGKLSKYNTAAQMKNGDVTILEKPVAAPKILGVEAFETSTEVTITAEEGLKIFYTLNGDDPTTSSTEYSAPFELSVTTTVKAIAYNSITAKSSAVTEKTFTKTIIPTKTIAGFIEDQGGRCYLEGIVSNITNTTYGNFDLTDASGTIYVYGCLNAVGESKKFAELGVKNGDKIKVIADEYELYEGTTKEAKNVQYVSHISAATITIENITLVEGDEHAIVAVVTPAEAEGKVTYSIKSGSEYISLAGNVITANAVGTATITATIATAADYMGTTKDFTVTVKEYVAPISGRWELVTDASTLKAGDKVIVAQYVEEDGTIYTMGGQKANNRDVVESSVSGITLTPTTGTTVLTLVDAGNGTFALQASNGNYLYAASNTSNHLKETATINDNAKWSVSVTDGKASVVAQGANTHNTIRFNKSNTPKIFSCYESGQQDIALYKKMPNYTRVVDPQYYGTICLPKAGKFVGGSLYEVAYYDETTKKVYFDEVLNGEMEAGMPYIFLANATMIEAYYASDEESEAKNKNGLYGTLVDITSGMNADGVYMIYRNQIIHSTNSGSYLKANRAYIKFTEELPGYNDPSYVAQAPAPGRKRIAMGTTGQNTATGVDQVQGDNVPTKMIINGQLFILRGEKMYDAQGKLVK